MATAHIFRRNWRPVSYWYTLSKPATSAAFVDYLDHHASKHPILVQTPRDGRIELRWDPSLKCRKQTQLNLTSEGVWVEAICLAAERPLRRFEAFGGLVADLDEKRLGLIEEGQGWSFYQHFYRIYLSRLRTPEGWKKRSTVAPWGPVPFCFPSMDFATSESPFREPPSQRCPSFFLSK